MKKELLKSKCLVTIIAAFGLQLIGSPAVSAQDLYHVNLNAINISTNQDGRLVCKQFDNRDLIRETASEQGITNLEGLSLTYNPTNGGVEVVSGTNDTVIGTPLTFSGGVSLVNTNTNHTEGQLLEYVYWDTNTVASGTLVAGETYCYGPTNQITDFNLHGQLQFAQPNGGTNGPSIYIGDINVEYKLRLTPIEPDPWDHR
jgi:hypothetical protein